MLFRSGISPGLCSAAHGSAAAAEKYATILLDGLRKCHEILHHFSELSLISSIY